MQKAVIGKIIVAPGTTRRDASYECAAWYQDLDLTPGEYDLTIDRFSGTPSVSANLPGTVTASNFASYFAGNTIPGSYQEERAGQAASYRFMTYAFAVAEKFVETNGCEMQGLRIELAEGVTAERVDYDFEAAGKRIQGHTHCIFIDGEKF